MDLLYHAQHELTVRAWWRQGHYVFKLLAVDVPTASSAEQRLYVEGDAKLYHRGGVINELRDPFIQVRPTCCGSASQDCSTPACKPDTMKTSSANLCSIDALLTHMRARMMYTEHSRVSACKRWVRSEHSVALYQHGSIAVTGSTAGTVTDEGLRGGGRG